MTTRGAPVSDEVKDIMSSVLNAFGKADKLDTYLEYLESEWYNSLDDLRLAIDDGQAWSDLKLPGRFKLEIKKNILSKQGVRQNSKEVWLRCYSPEDDCEYFYNAVNGTTQWEEPIGEEIVDDTSYRLRTASRYADDISRGSTGQPHDPPEAPLTRRGLSDEVNGRVPPASAPSLSDESRSHWTQHLSLLSAGITGGMPHTPSTQNTNNAHTPSSPPVRLDTSFSPSAFFSPSARIAGMSTYSSEDSLLPTAVPVSLSHDDFTEDSAPTLLCADDVSVHLMEADEETQVDSDTVYTGIDGGTEIIENDGPVEEDYVDNAAISNDAITEPPSYLVSRLMEMGFVEDDCIQALEAFDNDLSAAAAHLLSNVLPGN
mmetsp:Transcript_35191/g.35836  ORF Transcript_35191/g.35836 Transcript_35191/m.35836 type:complete len:373 (+) Transcript_35191:217-1335(+)|eukprot:CAMPEP_0182420346 /NCGR_PEP_ID=MMETSP1167-20130531/5082_1 /TAXON_ID=2988 /ORGANISM="Mallomonas Sp, Strain CCMP3275" /LENGTH=372 /DNA_ID=CAMNT_0024596191 /DNA_START=109 /DNA_END=1230 /DNA_ORIENTATION=+